MSNLPTMTGPALYDFMDQLRLKSEQMSMEWKSAIHGHPFPREICEANAEKWAKMSEIFKDTQSRIYDAARSELGVLRGLMERSPFIK